MSDTNAAAPAAPNNRKKLIGALAILSALIVVGSVGVASVVWWNLGEEEDVATATPPAPVVTPATSAATPPAPVAAEPGFAEKLTAWWSAGNEPDLGESLVEPATKPTVVTPATAQPASAGFTASGRSFLAPDDNGNDVATAEVMLGEVADSSRSASGLTEIYWVQGTHQDPMTNARVDQSGKVVDPDDIRRVVGIRTTWTAIPGNTDVFVKCIKVHGTDDEVPGSCLPVQTASR